MFARTEQLNRIEAALERIEAALAGLADAVSLDTAGGLAVVVSEAKDARTAAESAFVGMQALASQATARPGLPEVVKAVSAQTDALKAMEQSVRTATGPQPVLAETAPPPAAAPPGMGRRIPPKTRGSKP